MQCPQCQSENLPDSVFCSHCGTKLERVCPHCQIMPVRVWDTFVADGNSFMLGAVYATDNGAKVIEGAEMPGCPSPTQRVVV